MRWMPTVSRSTQPPVAGRRRSELITPVPKPAKSSANRAGQLRHAGRTRPLDRGPGVQPHPDHQRNPQLRRRLARAPEPVDWGVTPATQRLLRTGAIPRFHPSGPSSARSKQSRRRSGWPKWPARERRHDKFRKHLLGANEQANPELFRIALKMATGSGKTTVMAMLIAWQTVNAVRTPGSNLYSRGFLIVTPGITIKDRLRVLLPNDPDSYYRDRELVPADMLPDIDRAKIVITNYHAFKPRETLEISKTGRSLLQGRDAPPEPSRTTARCCPRRQ